jgi:hypothetical protein
MATGSFDDFELPRNGENFGRDDKN